MRKSNLEDMGQRGRAWMNSDYSWGFIAKKVHELYGEVIGEVSKNDCGV
jgi:hypothetical protein